MANPTYKQYIIKGMEPNGTNTGLKFKKGDIISILAVGWIKFASKLEECASPQGYYKNKTSDTAVKITNSERLFGPDPDDNNGLCTLKAKFGQDSKTNYYIGNGQYHWEVPEDGELILFFLDDSIHDYTDNSGEFAVRVYQESQISPASPGSEKKGIQQDNKFTFTLPANKKFGVTTLLNSSASIAVNIYDGDKVSASPLWGVTRTGTGVSIENETFSEILTTGTTGKITIEILANGQPVKQTKYAYQLFDKEPYFAIFAAEDGTDNDFNDAIVILNWPLG